MDDTSRRTTYSLEVLKLLPEVPFESVSRPKTRADCIKGPRPCPYVTCRHNLYCDINYAGGLQTACSLDDFFEPRESCALDVADRGGETLEAIGKVLGISRERVRQIEEKALAKVKRGGKELKKLMFLIVFLFAASTSAERHDTALWLARSCVGEAGWKSHITGECAAIAEAFLRGEVEDPLPSAMHYGGDVDVSRAKRYKFKPIVSDFRNHFYEAP